VFSQVVIVYIFFQIIFGFFGYPFILVIDLMRKDINLNIKCFQWPLVVYVDQC